MSTDADATATENACNDVVRRFEAAWRESVPDLALFLPPDGPARRIALVELIATDAECRHRRGRPVRAADYLARFPELLLGPDLAERVIDACRELAARPPAADAEAPAGLRVGRYELREPVGEGVFGRVYRAVETNTGRCVAVKLLRPSALTTADRRRRLLREVQAPAGLAHPGLVTVCDSGEADGHVFLVSAFVDGPTLAAVLRQERPALTEAVGWLAEVADALDHAHQQGVFHRDVKPSNILLERSEDGARRARLVDFGLARGPADETTLTRDGELLGTPAYAAPELLRGEGRHADGRCDIYSLGVILYELLAGEVPFSGGLRLVLHQVLHDEPPRRARATPGRLPIWRRSA